MSMCLIKSIETLFLYHECVSKKKKIIQFVLAFLQLGRMEQKKYMCNCVAQLILSLPFFIAVSPRDIFGNLRVDVASIQSISTSTSLFASPFRIISSCNDQGGFKSVKSVGEECSMHNYVYLYSQEEDQVCVFFCRPSLRCCYQLERSTTNAIFFLG